MKIHGALYLDTHRSLVTQAGLMLTYGQVLTIARTKWIYLFAITVFELGSLICAVSPSIEVLIFGRAIQGVGASGIFITVLTVIAQTTKLESRPVVSSAPSFFSLDIPDNDSL